MADSPASRRVGRILNEPEAGVSIFALLLNLPWEFFQIPFYQGMATAPHWEAVQLCARAALGDAGIALVAFWTVAAAVRDRDWIWRPRAPEVLGFIAAGAAMTVVFERLATGPLSRWTYADLMPIVPVLKIGMLPLLQWILLPPLIIWFARRYLRGA